MTTRLPSPQIPETVRGPGSVAKEILSLTAGRAQQRQSVPNLL